MSYADELMATGEGGTGYLLKDRVSDLDDFLTALDTVARGGTVLDPLVVRQLTVTLGAVEKHTQRIFAKLGLHHEDDASHRRVLAVIQYLRSA